MSAEMKTFLLCIALIGSILFVAWVTITRFGPPGVEVAQPLSPNVHTPCLAQMPGGFFLPCSEVEPRLYPLEWWALGQTI